MAATYPAGIVAFTQKNDGDVISSSHIDALQDEVVAIETGLRNGLQHPLKTTGSIYERGRVVALGDVNPVTFAATDFTANAGATWTVAAGNVVMWQYLQIGRIHIVQFDLANTTILTSAASQLLIHLPFSSAFSAIVPYWWQAAGTNGIGVASCTGGATLTLFKDATLNALWPASPGNARVSGTIILGV